LKLDIRCPAKLNLFLAIGPKDRNGYHPLRTIFQAIDLCDGLEIDTEASETSISSPWSGLPRQNTVSKALRLASDCALIPPLRVVLHKAIPHAAGLGGGSSDAAGLLRALPRLGVAISGHHLLEIAGAVGADVPFFLVGGRARAEGYGEKLTSLPDPPAEWFVVAAPAIGCGTSEMYGALDVLRGPKWTELAPFPTEDILANDFEQVAPPESRSLIEALLHAGAKDAALTGSGSAVFGRFSNAEQAERARLSLPKVEGIRSWVAKSLGRSESLA
jgi:4-diphosphocytidyl-2-C-methyl-D-erythritol kinase